MKDLRVKRRLARIKRLYGEEMSKKLLKEFEKEKIK